jgi:uncharacterized protein (TIGR03089 family)
MSATLEQAFADQLARDPGRPFVTYYDGVTGERSELSVRSLGNWVAKTHFLLVDELGLGAGDTAAIALPLHWISVPVVLGCLTAGLVLSTDPDAAAVGFAEPDQLAAVGGVPEVYAVNPAAAAVGFRDAPPAGALDYVAAVRPQPDKWPTVRFGATASDPCMDGRTRAEVADQARGRAGELGIVAGARVLTMRDWSGAGDWLDTLFAPLAVGGGVG